MAKNRIKEKLNEKPKTEEQPKIDFKFSFESNIILRDKDGKIIEMAKFKKTSDDIK